MKSKHTNDFPASYVVGTIWKEPMKALGLGTRLMNGGINWLIQHVCTCHCIYVWTRSRMLNRLQYYQFGTLLNNVGYSPSHMPYKVSYT